MQGVSVPHQVSFYLLTCNEVNVEASAQFIKLDGGAGYLWEKKGESFVVVSIYKKEGDAERVRQSLNELGGEYSVQSVHIQNLYFKGKDKRKRNIYISALNTFRGHLDVIRYCISNLDAGSTQEQIKKILLPVRRQLENIAQEYKKEYASFSGLCCNIATQLQEIEKGIVYSSDLRYILCAMEDGYLELCNQFAL
jgi:hypothetical protein